MLGFGSVRRVADGGHGVLGRREWMVGMVAAGLMPAAARSAEPLSAVVGRHFEPLLAAHAVPGMSIAVLHRGDAHLFSYGTTSAAGGDKVTDSTLFELGSISKIFTATLGGLAEALGRIAPGDHPGQHLPDLRGTPIDAATLLQLGTYTAGGLPLQFPDGLQGEAAILRFFSAWRPEALPGTQRRYSNPSIGLFGHVAARAMGGAYAELAERELFPALGLRDTYIHVPRAAMPRYAWGHGRNGDPIRVAAGPLDAEAYGVKSTAADMLRFLQAQLHPDGLPSALRHAIAITHEPRYRSGALVQALGWERYSWPAPLERLLEGNSPAMALQPHRVETPVPQNGRGTLLNKTGSTNGFGAYVALLPEHGTGLAMLANRNLPNAERVRAAHAVLSALA
ncbi:class C beta-lactamase [Pseudoroseomonas globiformis]|uniref:Beta-lactamase n=1 Tax=Teichococcus globiformis TaxID=2307229 RepID=A0ABV7FVQ8_9PROT